jgi:hypothetical protein
LVYHYGPYAMAAFLSKAIHLRPAISLFHVVRGIALIFVFGATIGLSRILSQRSARYKMAITFGIIGLFFLGSFTAFFSGELLPKIKGSDAGMVNLLHYLTGFSLLWAHVGLITVIGILLSRTMQAFYGSERQWGIFLVPGILVSLNIFASLAAAGLVAATFIWVGNRRLMDWLWAAATGGIVLFFIYANGIFGGPVSSIYFIELDASSSLFRLFVWSVLGLGIRTYGFQMIKKQKGDPISWIVLLLTVGPLVLYLLISDTVAPQQGGETDQYFLIIPQGLYGIFSMVMLAGPIEGYLNGDTELFERGLGRFLKLYIKIGSVFIVIGLIYLLIEVTKRTDMTYSLNTMFLSSMLIVGAWTLHYLYRQSKWIRRVAAKGFVLLLSLSLCAWIPVYLHIGINWLPGSMRTYLTSGEVEGLQKLRDLSQPDDLIATNRHYIFKTFPCSYNYSAISERQMVLEGWYFRLSDRNPTFAAIREDNDLLFSTNDPLIAHRIVEKYGIKFIICQPDTDIHFMGPNVKWLQQIQPAGSLNLYRVV